MPPMFIQLAKRLRGNRHTDIYGLSGDYCSWNEAKAASTGYDNMIILKKTKDALLKVRNGEAAYERDSVLFDKVQYAWSVLAGLLLAAAKSGGRLNVLDFGGSLGSSYFQNRAFIQKLSDVRWSIVEQPTYVYEGKKLFENEHLKFYESIEECVNHTTPNVVLLSGVLQYLEYPYIVFEKILELPCDYIIIDRTPFWSGPIDRLCVQTVPPDIYPASYPIWIFSTELFYAYLRKYWNLIAKFNSLDRLPAPVKTIWQGFILERNKSIITQERLS
jgi:putative methyltransferase (TIGR04325 family)